MTGEIAASGLPTALDATDARALTDQIKAAERLDRRIRLMATTINDGLSKLYELVEAAKASSIHLTLGYPSWTAYMVDACKVEIKLDRDRRRELVGWLSGEGMSQRAIADVVGISKNTVTSDIGQVSQSGTPEEDVDDLAAALVALPAEQFTVAVDAIIDGGVKEHAPAVRGLDGKTYPRAQPRPEPPPTPKKPRRKPITDQATTAGWELRKAVERVKRIADDDRFDRHIETLDGQLGRHLVYAVEILQPIIDRLDAKGSGGAA